MLSTLTQRPGTICLLMMKITQTLSWIITSTKHGTTQDTVISANTVTIIEKLSETLSLSNMMFGLVSGPLPLTFVLFGLEDSTTTTLPMPLSANGLIVQNHIFQNIFPQTLTALLRCLDLTALTPSQPSRMESAQGILLISHWLISRDLVSALPTLWMTWSRVCSCGPSVTSLKTSGTTSLLTTTNGSREPLSHPLTTQPSSSSENDIIKYVSISATNPSILTFKTLTLPLMYVRL